MNSNKIRESFRLEQEILRSKLALSEHSVDHPTAKGEVNEDHFLEFLRQYLPRRYAVDSAFVIDSRGGISDQIDVVIYDPHYTPTLLDQQSHRFVTAEAVYAVFEVKPAVNKAYLEYAADKAASVRKLFRTSVEIATASGRIQAKEPFHITAGIIAVRAEWKDGLGASFVENYLALTEDRKLDSGIALEAGTFDTYEGELSISLNPACLSKFMFRLLRQLQNVGTVTAIDWFSYGATLGDV